MLAFVLLGTSSMPRTASAEPPSDLAERSEIRGFEEPDLPAFMRGRMDMATYLLLRAEALASKRGLPYDLPYDARVRAIRDLEVLERSTAHANSPDIIEAAWTQIGPAPIPNGQTTTVSTPVSGRTIAIAVHPTDPNKVYVGTAQGGLYRTLDGGTTWTALTDSLLSLAIGAVAIDPSDPTRVWIGTGESGFSADSFFGVGLYRMTNSEAVTPTIEGPFNLNTGGSDVMSKRSISRILINPTTPNTVFVSTASGIGGLFADNGTPLPGRGLFRSTNALAADPRFDRLNVPTGSTNVPIMDMVFDPNSATSDTLVAYAFGLGVAADPGVWRSTDANAVAPTFTRTLVLGQQLRGELAVNNVSSVTTMLLASGETAGAGACGTTPGTLRRSIDGGATWSTPLAAANGFCGGQCFYDIFIGMDPGNASNIYLGGAANGACTRVYTRSTDAGVTFTGAAVADVGLHADSHAVAVAPSNPSIVYESGDGGIFKSTDAGATWTSLNNAGFHAVQFQSVAYHPTDPNFSIGGTQDNGTQFMNSAGAWTRADFGDGGQSEIDQNATDTTTVTAYHTYFNQTNALIGFARNNLTSCYAQGNWTFKGIYGGAVDPTVFCDGTTDTFNGIAITDAVEFYAPLALGPGNPNTVYYGTNKLYRSANKGDTMPAVSQTMASTVTAIGIAPSDDNVRVVGLRNGGVFKTTTGANPLTDADAGNAIPNNIVNRIVVDPNNADIAYVALNGFGLAAGAHIWKTTNLSNAAPTWTLAGSGIPDVPVTSMVINPGNSLHLYAGTDIGVFNSIDGGVSWTAYSQGLPRVAVFDMALQNVAGDRRLRIATHGRGIWERVPVNVPVELLGLEVE
jgi:photosystem II stability/assembly factor-like uncharacterized protein